MGAPKGDDQAPSIKGGAFGSNRGFIVTGGSVSANNLAVGDNASITTYAAPETAADVVKLIAELRQQLSNASIPAEHRDAIKTLADQVETEVQKEHPNRTLGQITAAGLKGAAEAVKEVAPTLLAIAAQVATWFAAG